MNNCIQCGHLWTPSDPAIPSKRCTGCGSRRWDRPGDGRVDLAGSVFGALTVKALSARVGARSQRYWDCECSCGASTTCRGTHLTGGKIVSCGNKTIHCKTPAEERFWNFVNKDGPIVREYLGKCWLWIGGIDSGWYGAFRFNDTKDHAHRVSWILHKGPIPIGLQVLHKCDISACINPEHLFLGTAEDNMRDMYAKGRAHSQKRESCQTSA